MGCLICGRDRDKELIRPGFDQAVEIGFAMQLHAVGLDADMGETGLGGTGDDGWQVAAKGDLCPGQHQTDPWPLFGLHPQHRIEIGTIGWSELLHRAFDHAMGAAQVAAEFHCDGHPACLLFLHGPACCLIRDVRGRARQGRRGNVFDHGKRPVMPQDYVTSRGEAIEAQGSAELSNGCVERSLRVSNDLR